MMNMGSNSEGTNMSGIASKVISICSGISFLLSKLPIMGDAEVNLPYTESKPKEVAEKKD